MTMKTILVPFRDDDTARVAVEASCRIAKQFGSHMEGLFIQTPPLVYASEGIAIGGYVTQLADEERRRADDAEGRFKELIEAHDIPLQGLNDQASGPSANWYQIDGLSEQVVGERGRLFDLVAVGRETRDSSPDWGVICEAALFESGRLVFLASPELPDTMGENVVICWNGSTETARTIALSMPFLLAAKRVSVLTVEGVTVPGPSGEQIVRTLLRNGVHASAHTAQLEGRAVGEATLEEAEALGADLLVKGAYAHSRLRQMIFGGVTRHILTSTEIPALMAH
ncbi:MAG: universal stress protein [Gammaproteobacteria bacterium]|nr:universal stress protein [Gammaproteobacteria bacterium]